MVLKILTPVVETVLSRVQMPFQTMHGYELGTGGWALVRAMVQMHLKLDLSRRCQRTRDLTSVIETAFLNPDLWLETLTRTAVYRALL